MKMSNYEFINVLKILCFSGVQKNMFARAPFLPIDMSKTFLGSFSCLLAGWISLQFFSIHFFFLILSTTNFYNFLTISVFNHDFSHLLSLKVSKSRKQNIKFSYTPQQQPTKFFTFFQRRTQNHPWAIIFCLPKNLCTYQDIPFKHPIGGGQLPKNVCKIL